MRFGLFIPQGWRMDLVGVPPEQHWGVMAGLAARADSGQDWESIWVYDHFHTVPVPSDEATHEAWSLMAAFAASTSRVRLGQMCTCMSYRHPAYLAKVAATIDVISEGRVEMGIGAGWYEHEWRAYGFGFPSAGERLARLDEGVQIFRQMWTTGRATLAGAHYQVDGAICAPRPLQGTSMPGSAGNGIPIWVAGGGERKTLRIAAQYADYTNFGNGSLTEFKAKSAILRQHCETHDRDFAQITRSTNVNIVIGESEREVRDRLGWIRDHMLKSGVPQQVVDDQMPGLESAPGTGTPEQITERLRALQDAGMGYLIAYFHEIAYDTSGLDHFERHVMPHLRD